MGKVASATAPYAVNHVERRQASTLSYIPTYRYNQGEEDRRATRGRGFFSSLGASFGQIAENISDLFTLRIDLLKAELRDSAKTAARNSVYIAAGAGLAMVAVFVLSAALVVGVAMLLPWNVIANIAVSCLAVGLIYTLAAALLVRFGIKHLKEHGLKPEKSVQEMRNDKQWINEIKSTRPE